MLITDLISKEIIPVSTNTTVEKALQMLDGFHLTHIPLFEGLTFLGNISEAHLNESPLQDVLTNAKPYVDYFFLTETSSIFDAINEFYTHDTNVIPVLNNQKEYLGVLLVEDVMGKLSKLPLLSEPSAMLTVKIPTKQFSMSEVAKIVESNNGRIFGSFISGFEDDLTEITIKFNAESLSSVVETFERFGYLVKLKFFNDEKQDMMHDRYDQLMKYLDV